ncbi:MAG: hypothetical protein COS49_01090 [Candidatus Portnoybacteria bacterium CG03_land_8_20_14_0_80_41_10]|uniref:Uncharacterized protein n=1 Tax=Candidatus Portnoybacteria bacterium CG03_land_8_20_14_0_80_41_10 TaxID=1974808 RepID=A0A2M7BUX8_9BACT|nr:MAG: hypothetical protein COS49_01090 [Candidatus Portnoybacteria bacterium CG03_land_8_20_14_0_80_41_10]
MNKEVIKLAKLLRISEEVILNLEKKMEKISGQKGVVEKIVQENDRQVERVLKELRFRSLAPKEGKKGAKLLNPPTAEKVYQGLIDKVKKDDQNLFKHFHRPDFSTALGYRSLINATKELTNHLTGFYLKETKAKELLLLNPPKQIMANLGYGADVDKMLAQEDVFEIFCALRFVEDSRWLNDVFFKPYRDLTRDDFEEREIKVMALPERWTGIGQKFLGKKLHHMSHLKELGVVFVIPITKRAIGETLYLFFMTLHYTYEVDWHSRLFKKYSQENDFTKKMINALKVEVTGRPLPNKRKMSWRIVAKYLAKNDPNDPRLAEPHISPEAWHYTKAALAINQFAKRFPETGLAFWQGLDVVGEYFPVDNSKEENLISFDLFDNGISLLQQIGFESKYLYHQQEALWNEVFINYLGQGELDKIMMENLDKGYISL